MTICISASQSLSKANTARESWQTNTANYVNKYKFNSKADSSDRFLIMNIPCNETPSTPGPLGEGGHLSKTVCAQKSKQLREFMKSPGKDWKNRFIRITPQPPSRANYGYWHSISSIQLTPKWHFQPPWTTKGGWTQAIWRDNNQICYNPDQSE